MVIGPHRNFVAVSPIPIREDASAAMEEEEMAAEFERQYRL